MKIMKEIWSEIPDFEGVYLVSNKGKVKRISSNNCLTLDDNGKGYLRARLYYKDKFLRKYIHRLVALSFIPNPLNKPHINHIDGNPKNNNWYNLEWVTKSENEIHAHKYLGKSSPMKGRLGKDNPKSKQVFQINKNGTLIASYLGVAEASRITGINHSQISNCALGKYKSAGSFIWKYNN